MSLDTNGKDATQMGYAIPYQSESADFRVYFCGFISLVAFGLSALGYGPVAFAVGLVFGGVAYHFYPLSEKTKPRLGANQYGIFIDGFGQLSWASIKSMEIKTYALRSLLNQRLHIELNTDAEKALIADWRDLPWWRLLMKLPWAQPEPGVITIELEPFGDSPEEILSQLERMWTFYGARY